MIRHTIHFLVLLAAATIAGCGPAAAPTTLAPSAPKIRHTVTVAEENLAKLEAADRADGQDDKTIHKCYVCGLGMAGSPENAVSVNDYVAHFCSPDCCDHFAKDPVAVISSTKIPQGK